MILNNLPMSISVNEYLRPLRASGRLVKTNAAQVYDGKMKIYSFRHYKEIEHIRSDLIFWIGTHHLNCIKLVRTFYFCEKRILGKNKEQKKLDLENFFKCNTDAISALIGIDDRYFRFHEANTEIIQNNCDEFIRAEFIKVNLNKERFL